MNDINMPVLLAEAAVPIFDPERAESICLVHVRINGLYVPSVDICTGSGVCV
jgi:hypothetical protein